ncbi:senescence-induced receptor-like serine/threonine-protein kinase [Triticum aestivum]|uniref:senescence-induced receptor-like serine/threonine-protein kinase n=1 Tax=Triticum aestivum TaxID=4565 RepID=UPI001D023C17|nr:senescence-induced receptor-like serine/threonine-protein kinase [Triticum aestivum]
MVINFSCSASTKLTWILALLLILVTTIQVHGQSTTDGFVNIDCGFTNSSAYIDSTLKIPYRFDGELVDGGLSNEILKEFMAGAGNEQQKTLRSFPDGSRNCYTLPSTIGQKYLLRAMFTYGNYDRLNRTMGGSLFRFGLHIGVNFWEAVNLTNTDPSSTIWKEVLTVAPGNNLSVCLINFGTGTPFVSSLELRPLQDTMYPFVNTSVSISYFNRIRFGNVTDPITRYPTDDYDRFWESWPRTSYAWINLDTDKKVERLPGDSAFNVPSTIFQKASTIDMNISSTSIIVAAGPNLDTKSLQLLPIFHFADISNSSLSRRFDIYSAEGLLFPDFSPLRFQMDSKYKIGHFLQNADVFFTLNKTSSSRLPPLINALEVYSLVRMDNLTTDSGDAKYIKEVKTHYNLAQRNWNGDPCSPREYSWEGLTCDYSKSNQNPRIVTVNLSTSRLRGGFAISFMNMTSLENLDLSHNNLTGAIPDYQLKSLKFLDLSNNKLDGPIPDSILQRFQAGSLDLRLEGNPVCSNVKDTYCSKKKKNTTSTMLIAVIVPVVLVSLLVVMGILWKLYWKGKTRKSGDDEDSMYEEETPLHIDIRRFTYAELKHITNDFQSVVGKGGFGTVYHGTLENDDEVAVKVLMEKSIAESTDFLPEVQTLSKVHHKNLVTLQGYCQNKNCLALVYDFMPRGNLQQLLRGGDYSLNWEQRLHIALDAAQGLEYLHELCTPSIVHRDVKTPNILLDKNLVGIISDFGLSRAFNDARTHISTAAAAGTPGYIDPEYHASYQITVKTDVYSFGIVLLEIFTGQPPLLMDPQTVHLPNWVRQKIAMGSIHDVVDKRLLDQYDASSLQSVVDLAMNCVENAAIDRPTMTVVATRLKGLLPTVSSEKQSASATPRRTYSMDSEIPRQFQLMISGASNEGSSFQSGYTNGMSETSLLSGR